MTDQPRDDQFDRLLQGFLAWQAEDLVAPPTAAEVAMRIGSRTGIGGRRARVAPQLVWVALLGLLVAGVVGAAMVGARLLQSDPSGTYEAVFVRRGVDDPRALVVVGVDAMGRERQIASLPGAGLSSGPPVGVVSPRGLLAVPRSADGYFFHWEIIDLLDPQAAPIVVPGIEQDAEQLQPTPFYRFDSRPGVLWGPGDRLAIPWYERCPESSCTVDYQLTFVDGDTGASSTVDVPDDVRLMPLWAADGSGVFVDRGAGLATTILRPDGTVTDTTVGIAQTGFGRRYRADGVMVEARGGAGIMRNSRDGTGYEAILVAPGAPFADAAWTAAGDGVWLATRSGPGRDLAIERLTLPSNREPVAAIHDRFPVGLSRPEADFVGFAPDDSLLVLSMDRVTGTEENGGTEPVLAKALIAPGTGAAFEVEGAFAGWLETTRSPVAPSPSTSPTPSTTPQPSPSAGFSRFDSPLNGLSIDYPSGWQVRPATEPWTGGALDFDSPAADVIFDPALGDRLYLVLASAPHSAAGSAGLLDDDVALPEICRSEGDGGGSVWHADDRRRKRLGRGQGLRHRGPRTPLRAHRDGLAWLRHLPVSRRRLAPGDLRPGSGSRRSSRRSTCARRTRWTRRARPTRHEGPTGASRFRGVVVA